MIILLLLCQKKHRPPFRCSRSACFVYYSSVRCEGPKMTPGISRTERASFEGDHSRKTRQKSNMSYQNVSGRARPVGRLLFSQTVLRRRRVVMFPKLGASKGGRLCASMCRSCPNSCFRPQLRGPRLDLWSLPLSWALWHRQLRSPRARQNPLFLVPCSPGPMCWRVGANRPHTLWG